MKRRPWEHRATPRGDGSAAAAGVSAADTGPAAAAAGEPMRRCIGTMTVRPRRELLRFVVAPDGMLVPDVEGRLPGRGLWLTPRRDIISQAAAKKVFSRAARQPVIVPEDLAQRTETLLARRCGELVGLARRAGAAVAGYEKVREALRAGRVGVLLAASDGAANGRDKLRALAPALPLIEVLTGAELGAAFGRDHTVHGAVAPGRLAEHLLRESARLAGFRTATPATTPGAASNA
jgi:uncharacterized protein